MAGSDSAAEDEKAMTSRDRMSAREARSRRRQAKIDEDAPFTTTTATGGLGEEATHSAKRRLRPPPNHGKKRQRQADDGEVVKVKLLTGTLYLYRGQHRRVEFVRRV
jgi:hypothetical protein